MAQKTGYVYVGGKLELLEDSTIDGKKLRFLNADHSLAIRLDTFPCRKGREMNSFFFPQQTLISYRRGRTVEFLYHHTIKKNHHHHHLRNPIKLGELEMVLAQLIPCSCAILEIP